jgi:hypothetical protein
MLLNQKVLSIIVISFSIITLCLSVATILGYINIDIMMLFLGITQVSGGLSQISLAKSINKDGVSKGNRTAGIVSLIIGVVIITMDCIKILL